VHDRLRAQPAVLTGTQGKARWHAARTLQRPRQRPRTRPTAGFEFPESLPEHFSRYRIGFIDGQSVTGCPFFFRKATSWRII
jgi:hypothetical protein